MRRGVAVVEIVRLAIVLLFLSAGFVLGQPIADLVEGFTDEVDPLVVRFVTSLLGALVGYVLGGVGGRTVVTGVDIAEERLRTIEAPTLISGILGALLFGILGTVVLWPLLLLPQRAVAILVAVSAMALFVYTGVRLGAARAGDLLRFVGARGRLQISTPSWSRTAKYVDTSALIDGRIVDVVRAGFIDGPLVIPRFVVDELQRLADTEDRRRRHAGRRGLDMLATLVDEGIVGVEVGDHDAPGVEDVDAKLATLARTKKAALITVDSNLARAAEVGGVRVLNLHALAEAVRTPVIPGERIVVDVTKKGREAEQGVGYLPDGTMVVVERASSRVGEKVAAEVTSLLQTRNGRMVFANVVEDGT